MNANRFLSIEEHGQVTQAVIEAEKKTSAEIICAVATESGRYDRAESIVGLIFALGALCLAHLFGSGLFSSGADWARPAGVGLGWQTLAVVLGFTVGTVAASFIHPLRRVFVREGEMESEVVRAGWHVFALGKTGSTRGRTGLLIYLSLFERRVLVLADDTACEVLGQERLDELRDIALAEIQEQHRVEVFTATIRAAAEHLAEALPAGEDNPEELPNHILIFHPRP